MSYTVTVYIAAPGTPEANGQTSNVGHMWYQISNGNSEDSYGYAPQASSSPALFAPGQVYINDTANYTDNGINTPYFSQTVTITEAQYTALQDYGNAAIESPGYYDAFTNSCVDFTWGALATIGIEQPFYFPGTELLPTWNVSAVQQSLDNFAQNGPQSSATPTDMYSSTGNITTQTYYNSTGGIVSQTTYTYNAANNSYTDSTTNGVGSVINMSSGSINSSTGQASVMTEDMQNGTQVNEQQIVSTPENVITDAVSGIGAVTTLDGATVTLANGTQVTVGGNGNQITAGANVSAIVTGAADNYFVGRDSLDFSASSLQSFTTNGSGQANFVLSSSAPGDSEGITWNPTTGLAVLDLTGTTGQTFASSLGTINPGDVLNVNGAVISNNTSTGQVINSTQINSDGSQIDTSYDLSGGAWKDTVYDYNTTGQLTEVNYVNNDASSVTDFYNPSQGDALVTQEVINANGSGSVSWGSNGSDGSVTFTDTSGLQVVASATQDSLSVSGAGSLVYSGSLEETTNVGANSQLSFSGSNYAVSEGSGDTCTISGGNASLTISGNNSSGTVSSTTGSDVITATGTGDVLTSTGTASGATLNITGTGDFAYIDGGSGDVGNISGGNDGLTIYGSNSSGNISGTWGGDSISVTGGNDVATTTSTATNATLNISGGNDAAYIDGGSGDVGNISGGNDGLTIYGNNSSGDISGTWGGNSISVTGGNDVATTTATATNATLNILGGNDTAYIDGGSGDVGNISGGNDGLTIYGNNSSGDISGTWGGNSISVTGGNDVATTTATATNATLNILGGNDTAYIDGGSGDVGNISGGNDGLTIYGNNSSGDISGTWGGNSISVTGGNDVATTTATATNATLNILGGNDTAYIDGGSGDVGNISGGNDGLTIYGNNSSGDISGTWGGNSISVTGGNDVATTTATATNATLNILGGNDTAYIDGGSGDVGNISGSTDALTIYGNNSSGNISGAWGNNNITADGTGDSTTATGTNDTLQLSGSADTAITSGSKDTVSLTSGNGDLVNASSGDIVNVSGTNQSGVADEVIASGDTVTDASNDRTNVFGSGDTVTAGQNDYVGTWGSGDTISAGSGDGVWVDDGGGDSVTAASGDAVNVDGNGQSGTADAVNLSGGTVDVTTNSDVGVSGSGDTIDQGQSDNVSTSASSNDTYDSTTAGYGGFSGTGNDSGEGDGGDPIILNLSGGSVQTTSLTNSSVYFDVQNTSQQVQTAWITAGEGLLVYDPNNTNNVYSSANLVTNFSDLAALDSNKDGVLNSADSAWNSLKVWVDPTGNGVFNYQNLYTMAQLGITSINLKALTEYQMNNGNILLASSTFTYANGKTGNMAEAYLDFNPEKVSSVSELAPGVGSSILSGYGPGTYFQMSLGNGVVKNTAANLANSTLTSFNSLDQIDITNLAFGSQTTISFKENTAGTSGALSVSDGAHSDVFQILGQYMAAGFQKASDNGGGTVITYVPPYDQFSVVATSH